MNPVRFSRPLHCRGEDQYAKVSYPVKYGLFSRLETREEIFEFNLNHEIRHIRSKREGWPHPSEWLKRTCGNDWVYYSTGGYAGVFEAIGEYYLPNLEYPTNSLLGGKPFEENEIRRMAGHWHDILAGLIQDGRADLGGTGEDEDWAEGVLRNTPDVLEARAHELFRITGARVTVLPPDARHVDYNVIPLSIADGCLYKCAFCRVKNKKPFAVRTRADIRRQMAALRAWYKKDLVNYNALFLGEHDALNAPAGLILDTARQAYEYFGFSSSFMKDPCLFLFGSADSFLSADSTLFRDLEALPFRTYINIGLESCDPATLDILGKPVTPEMVTAAFERACEINATRPGVEISLNFVADESLPPGHEQSLLSMIGRAGRSGPKGCIYLSPLRFGRPSRRLLYEFYRLKSLSRYPAFLYLIQRL